MTLDEIHLTGKLVDHLRARGVRSFKGHGVEFDLAPQEPSTPQQTAAPVIEEERCKCGCPLYQHTNDGCGNGCESEKCGERN